MQQIARLTVVTTVATIEFVTPDRPSRPTSPAAAAPVVVETDCEEAPHSAPRLRAAPSRPNNVIPLPAHAGLEIWCERQTRRAR